MPEVFPVFEPMEKDSLAKLAMFANTPPRGLVSRAMELDGLRAVDERRPEYEARMANSADNLHSQLLAR